MEGGTAEDAPASEHSCVESPSDRELKRGFVGNPSAPDAKRFKESSDTASELERLAAIENEIEDHADSGEGATDHLGRTPEDLFRRLKELESLRSLRRRVRHRMKKNHSHAVETCKSEKLLDPPKQKRPVALEDDQESKPFWCDSLEDYKPAHLIRAIATEKLGKVRAFTKCGFAPEVINEPDKSGRTPLVQALLTCNPTVLALLLSVDSCRVKGCHTSFSDPHKNGESTPDGSHAQIDSGVSAEVPTESDGENSQDLEEEQADLEFVNCDDAFYCVPYFHLPLGKIGIASPTVSSIAEGLTYRVSMVYALLLWNKLDDFESRTDLDVSVIAILEDVKNILSHLKTHDNEYSLSSRSLDTVDFEVQDYEECSVVQRLASIGSLGPLRILVAAGASATCGILSAVQSRETEVFEYLLSHRETRQMLTHRFWVTKVIEECIAFSSWKLLDVLVRNAPDLTGDEFEYLARLAESLGVSNEFLEVFRRTIDQEEPEPYVDFDNSGPKTGIYTHSDCAKHLEPTDMPSSYPGPQGTGIPENPSRLEVLLDSNSGCLVHPRFKSCVWRKDCSSACLADILRVHDSGYVEYIKSQCDRAAMLAIKKPLFLDHDTGISMDSWNAARRASGCVIQAVEDVCNGVVRNAFCCVRPPGHHIGTNGAANPTPTPLEGADVMSSDAAVGSQGFCLLNNVAIGAAYAKYNFPSLVDRIAIVDFDIHHGNGTEQIIRNLAKTRRNLTVEAFANHRVKMTATLCIPTQKVWRDEDDVDKVFFCSIHGYDGTFYPATGAACETSTILNIPVSADGNYQYREKFTEKICPALLDFSPDLIILSAGFDGHIADGIGGGFSRNTDSDFRFITGLLVAVANISCEGRIVSVLEGGYNTALGHASPFARAVAGHLDALVYTSPQRICIHPNNSNVNVKVAGISSEGLPNVSPIAGDGLVSGVVDGQNDDDPSAEARISQECNLLDAAIVGLEVNGVESSSVTHEDVPDSTVECGNVTIPSLSPINSALSINAEVLVAESRTPSRLVKEETPEVGVLLREAADSEPAIAGN